LGLAVARVNLRLDDFSIAVIFHGDQVTGLEGEEGV